METTALEGKLSDLCSKVIPESDAGEWLASSRGESAEGQERGAKAQASCVTLNKSLNLSGPLALYLAMLAAPSPADLGLYGTSSQKDSP